MFENVLFHDNMNNNIDFFNPLENPFDKSRVIYCFASPFVIEPITRDFFFLASKTKWILPAELSLHRCNRNQQF